MSVHTTRHSEVEEELHIIREIDNTPETTQRELSSRVGISLGKVNFIVNALISKGFVKAENFRKSSNKKAYLYFLTPKGIEEKSRLTCLFLQRKVQEYERLQLEIERLREEMRQEEAKAGGHPSEEGDQSRNIL